VSHQSLGGCLIEFDTNLIFNSQVTFPNMVLTWYFNSSKERVSESTGDVEITPEVVEEFLNTLEQHNIVLDFYSGAWEGLQDAGAFTSTRSESRLVLTSETIYSIESLPSLVDTLQQACSKSIEAELQRATLAEDEKAAGTKARQNLCLVAAKVLYFGVGGGVNAFQKALVKNKGNGKIVWSSERGVARVILQVEFA
jgi:protein-histidine N-methyltransferase